MIAILAVRINSRAEALAWQQGKVFAELPLEQQYTIYQEAQAQVLAEMTNEALERGSCGL